MRTRAFLFVPLIVACYCSNAQSNPFRDAGTVPSKILSSKDSGTRKATLVADSIFQTLATLSPKKISSFLQTTRMVNPASLVEEHLKKLVLLPTQLQTLNKAWELRQFAAGGFLDKKFLAPFQILKKGLEDPFQLHSGLFSYEGLYNSQPLTFTDLGHVMNINASAEMSLMFIPIQVDYRYQTYPQSGLGGKPVFSFKYNLDTYSQVLQKRLKGTFKPQDLLPKDLDPIALLRSRAEAALRADMALLKRKYKGLIDGSLAQLGGLENFAFQDLASLQQQLLRPDWLDGLKEKITHYTQMQARLSRGEKVDGASFQQLKEELERYQGIQELMAKLQEHKAKWLQNGLVQKIRDQEILDREKIREILKDPSVISKIARQELNLNSIQKLFLKISKMNIGQSTPGISSLSAGNILFHGMHTELLSKGGSVVALGGQTRTFNSIQDLPFINTLNPNDHRLIGFQFNRIVATGMESGIAFLTFQSQPTNHLPFANHALPRQSKVITLRERLEIDKKNRIELELSKSSSRLLNSLDADSNHLQAGMPSLMGEGSFLDNAALSVQYSGTQESFGLDHDMVIKFAGLQYNNPSASFVPAGTKEGSVHLRKSFVKRKLQLMVRSNWREYKFQSGASDRWRNLYALADLKWKMKKGQSISLRYQPTQFVKVSSGIKSLSSSVERLAVNATLGKKMGQFQYRNNLAIAYQQNKFVTEGMGTSNLSLQVTAAQNFFIGTHSFFNNTSYSYVNQPTDLIFYNSMFSSDWGMSFSISKNLTGSSSLNYHSVKGWYQQLAIRQTITGTLGKNMQVYLYVDAGKNIRTLQPIPFNTVRAECSIQYLFNQP